MLALYRSGRQADALGAYQDARRTLVDELGIEPGPELQSLQKAVLEHDRDAGRGVRKPRAPAPFVGSHADRRRVGVLGGLGLLVLAGPVAAFLLTRGGGSDPVVVPPNALALIDPGSNEVIEAIRVGNSPGPIAVEAGNAWVVNINDSTISLFDSATQEVIHDQRLQRRQQPQHRRPERRELRLNRNARLDRRRGLVRRERE